MIISDDEELVRNDFQNSSSVCAGDSSTDIYKSVDSTIAFNYAFRLPTSKLGIYSKASVASDAISCATVGK